MAFPTPTSSLKDSINTNGNIFFTHTISNTALLQMQSQHYILCHSCKAFFAQAQFCISSTLYRYKDVQSSGQVKIMPSSLITSASCHLGCMDPKYSQKDKNISGVFVGILFLLKILITFMLRLCCLW